MDSLTIGISSIGIEVDTVVITCLRLLYLRPSNRLNNPPPFYFMINWAKKLETAKLGQFLIFSIRNCIILSLNQPFNWLVAFNCTNLSIKNLKKEHLCLKIVFGLWSSMVQILLYSSFFTLWPIYWNTNWTCTTTVISATVSCNMMCLYGILTDAVLL